jgi:phage gpG-like protein
MAGKASKYFFDKRRVMTATERAERRVLMRIGSYIRQTAKQSIKARVTPAPPGRPPGRKTGFLKKSILFAYDANQSSVVIGPTRAGKAAEITHALEYGGTTTNVAHDDQKQKIAARPFMGPAAAKNLPKLPAMWRDSIR